MKKTDEITETSVWPLFLTAQAVLVSKIEATLSDAGLPPLAWYDVLWALERAADKKLRMSQLAELTVLSRSNLTRLIDRLESEGMVERVRAKDDRRGAFAILTPGGRAMRRKMWPVYAQAIKELFEDHIDERDAATMRKAFRRVLTAARDRSAE